MDDHEDLQLKLKAERMRRYRIAKRSLREASCVDVSKLTAAERATFNYERQAAMRNKLLNSPEFCRELEKLYEAHAAELEGMTTDQVLKAMLPEALELLDSKFWG